MGYQCSEKPGERFTTQGSETNKWNVRVLKRRGRCERSFIFTLCSWVKRVSGKHQTEFGGGDVLGIAETIPVHDFWWERLRPVDSDRVYIAFAHRGGPRGPPTGREDYEERAFLPDLWTTCIVRHSTTGSSARPRQCNHSYGRLPSKPDQYVLLLVPRWPLVM